MANGKDLSKAEVAFAYFSKVVDKFGTPFIVLAFVAFVLYTNLPRYVDAQIDVMNSQAETLDEMKDTLRNSNLTLQTIGEVSDEQRTFMKQVLEDHVTQCQQLQKIHDKVSDRIIR
jgi:hypothetical protein